MCTIISSRYNLHIEFERGMCISQVGLTICSPLHTVPPRTYGHYSAHFIIDGKGTFTDNSKTYSLKKGDGFMIFPDIANSYTADEKEPFTYIYVNFAGNGDEVLCKNSGIDEQTPVFSFEDTEEFINLLFKMHAAGKDNKTDGYDVLGYFYIAMSKIIGNLRVLSESVPVCNNNIREYYVKNAVSYIENNYFRQITVKDVASFVNIDRTYLYRIFLETMKISPSRFLIRYRLKRAAVLMKTTNFSLAKIAVSTGFYDTSHFTKAFETEYGCTPSNFIKNKK